VEEDDSSDEHSTLNTLEGSTRVAAPSDTATALAAADLLEENQGEAHLQLQDHRALAVELV
jgi:hypothetical protein